MTVLTYDDQHDDPAVPSGQEIDLGRIVSETTFSAAAANALLSVSDWRTLTDIADIEDDVLPIADNPASTNWGARVTYSYDSLGRQASIRDQSDSDNDGTFETGETDRSTSYAYDPVSGGQSLIDSPEGVIRYAYEPTTGRLSRTWTDNNDTRYGYDAQGRLQTVTSIKLSGQDLSGAPIVVTYAYDRAGNLDTTVNDNGTASDTSDDLKHDYNYDGLNRLKVLDVTRGSTAVFSQGYVLRDDGLRDSVTENRQGSITTIDWEYDDIGRLTSETYDGPSIDYVDTYSFDLSNNRVGKVHDAVGTSNDETISYTYDADDRLTAEDSTINANDRTYTYDANGSTTRVTTNGSSTVKYEWDLRNRMTGVDSNGDNDTADAGDINYGYDGAGNRISRVVVGGTSTYYLIDQRNLTGYAKAIEEKASPAGDPVRSYVLGRDVLAQVDDEEAPLYFVKDGRGTTRALVDEDGEVVERYDFDAFGNEVSYTDGAGDPLAGDPLTTWLMPDGQRDFATKLDRNGVRDVAGYIGRMLSRDPRGEVVGDTLNANLYVYASNNPVYYTDPSGNMSLAGLMVGAGIAGTILGITFNGIGNYATNRPFFENGLYAGLFGFGAGMLAVASPAFAVGLGAYGAFSAGQLAWHVWNDPNATTGQRAAAFGLFGASVVGGVAGVRYYQASGGVLFRTGAQLERAAMSPAELGGQSQPALRSIARVPQDVNAGATPPPASQSGEVLPMRWAHFTLFLR